MEIMLLPAILIGFLAVVLIMPFWIKKSKQIGFLWNDMNKKNNPQNVAGAGGVVVILAFVVGVLYYIFVRTFIIKEFDGTTISIFALLSVILILAFTGAIDDFFGWKHGGLSKRFRLMLAIFASVPLVVISAGTSTMSFPFIGSVNLGLLYPFLLIPLGIVGATATYNFLAGFNGLEAGQGILILGFLSYVAYVTGSSWLSLIGLIMVACLIGFYLYNRFPAKVFPGDSLTWSVGALIAIMAILGNFEKIALVAFIPYIIETFLKARGKLEAHSFGKPKEDGSLELDYKGIYGLTHLSIFVLGKFKKKVYERDVVYFIFLIQLIFIGIAFLLM